MCSEGGCRNSSISSTHVSLRRKNVPKPLTQLGYCTTCAREEDTDLLTTISTLAVRGIITSSGIANRMYVLYVNVVGSGSGAHSEAALQAGPRADRSQPPPPLICTTWSVAQLACPPYLFTVVLLYSVRLVLFHPGASAAYSSSLRIPRRVSLICVWRASSSSELRCSAGI